MVTTDILAERDFLFLGSRMKRLAERLQSDALKITRQVALDDLQPSYMPVLASLDRHGSMTVTGLVDLVGFSQPAIARALSGMEKIGLIALDRDAQDKRQKIVTLTEKGQETVRTLNTDVWPRIEAAARHLCTGLAGDFMDQIQQMEQSLADLPLYNRPGAKPGLELVEYETALADTFYRINAEWIEDMFTLEEGDLKVLRDPQGQIINRGGQILFVKSPVGGIVGTGALMPMEDGVFELTKMGVSSTRRGEKAGEFLLAQLIQRARDIDVKELFLLTNKKCEAAIHLYEKLGFAHDVDIMARYGARYERCNVAMKYPL